MSGVTAGLVPVLDHDRWFKELLTTFFLEFLRLFFPKLAAAIDPNSIEFLNQEHFTNLLEGSAYQLDMVVKARFKDAPAYFVIHVEHQSTAPATFPVRFFRYFSALFEKHGCPVYPIVIYSHDRPRTKQPSQYRMTFPDGEVLRFQYRVVQLNRLSWRQFLKTPNPVASALMSKMKIAPRDRPRVKAECLRLMMTLKLDPARMKLIGSFVDAYLTLNDAEEKAFERALRRVIPAAKQEEVMEYVTSWERRGVEKGRQEGRLEGRQEGRLEGRQEGRQEGLDAFRSVLLDILATRFGAISESLVKRLDGIESLDELRRLAHVALTASSPSDLGLE